MRKRGRVDDGGMMVAAEVEVTVVVNHLQSV
jgi:hypothetical protein